MNSAPLDLTKIIRQLVRGKPGDLEGLFIAHLGLARQVLATETHRDELAFVTVRIDHVWICRQQCEPLDVSDDSGFLVQLPQHRRGRLFEWLHDPRWQAPTPCVAAPGEQKMDAAGY